MGKILAIPGNLEIRAWISQTSANFQIRHLLVAHQSEVRRMKKNENVGEDWRNSDKIQARVSISRNRRNHSLLSHQKMSDLENKHKSSFPCWLLASNKQHLQQQDQAVPLVVLLQPVLSGYVFSTFSRRSINPHHSSVCLQSGTPAQAPQFSQRTLVSAILNPLEIKRQVLREVEQTTFCQQHTTVRQL